MSTSIPKFVKHKSNTQKLNKIYKCAKNKVTYQINE